MQQGALCPPSGWGAAWGLLVARKLAASSPPARRQLAARAHRAISGPDNDDAL